jgi:hypothetical protein
MASGHVNRTKRPNTWLHRPACKREEKPCQLGAVHTWHFATRTNALTLRPVLRALWKRWACRLSRLRRTDPNVWSGRALQEDFVELADVRSCINVSGRTWTDAQDHARLAEMYRLLLVRTPHFMLITVQPFFFASS